MGGFLYTVVILLLVLGILVFVHELGHYWAAKAFGVWVHRFAVGIGPPIKRLSFRRGETEWAIAWLPIGGYVKMASREEDPSSGVLEGGAENAIVPPDRMFEAKPVWQRMVIILAGVTLNIVFALLVFIGLALKNGHQYDPTTVVGGVQTAVLPEEAQELADLPTGTRIVAIDGVAIASWGDIVSTIAHGASDSIVMEFEGRAPVVLALHRDQLVERARLATALRPLHPAVVGMVLPNSPASDAGIQPEDSLVSIGDQPVRHFSDAVAAIEASPDRELMITVVRDGAQVVLPITPRGEHVDPADTTSAVVGKIGVGQRVPYVSEPYSFGEAVAAGNEATWTAAGTIFRTLRGLLTRRVPASELGGPILIGQIAAESARAGVDVLLGFMALISVNLAIVNLLPIPVLDGGAFILLAIEGITRRPIPVRLREAVQIVGLLLVVLLMVLAFSNDIRRLIGW